MPHLPPSRGNVGRSSGIRGVLTAISPGVGHFINYKCTCALARFLVPCILSEKMEATAVKKVLVSIGENRRIVSFSSTPASSDAEILSKAIKETFGDVQKSGQEFYIQVRNKEWGGLFLDVLDQEIVDKAVINVLLKPQTHEVSCEKII